MSVKPHIFKEAILTIENLSLKLGDALILRDINIEILNVVRSDAVQGQVVVVLGRSGIGKTQLFKTIAGLQDPKSITGKILMGAEKKLVEVGRIGVVAQNYYITPRLTVMDTVVRAGRQGGLSRKEAKEKGLTLLEKFSIADKRNFYPAQLSGGQRQRVAIIEQLMCSEDFLLMDEPFSGLDYLSKQKTCETISKVASENEKNTIIIITHDIEAAVEVADTIWMLGRDRDEKGNIIPGARVIEKVDLMEMGLAWTPGIQFTREFGKLVSELKAKFSDHNGPYV